MGKPADRAQCLAAKNAASDYLDGHLQGQVQSAMEVHLANCRDCERFVEDLRETLKVLAGHRILEADKDSELRALGHYIEYYPEPALPDPTADWTDVKILWGQLVELSEDARLAVIREEDRYWEAALCDWLIARSRRVCSVDPERSVPFAAAALEVGRQRSLECGDTRHLILALCALAWCYLLLRDYPVAETLLQELGMLCDGKTEGLEETAEYLTTKGFYFSQIGRLQESERLLEEALNLCRKNGSRREVICALVNLAATAMSAGDAKRALKLYRAAEERLDSEGDPPRLQAMVFSSLVLALCEAGLSDEARELLPKTSELAGIVGGWYWKVYVTWLSGTLARVEGRYEAAGEIFEVVRSQFLLRGHLVWYVEASLDLARTKLRQGRLLEVRDLAYELVRVVEERKGDERVFVAVARFADAVQQRTVTSQLLGSLAMALSSAQLSRRLQD
jgi:tetratricopeptide (TPR) repeat protein